MAGTAEKAAVTASSGVAARGRARNAREQTKKNSKTKTNYKLRTQRRQATHEALLQAAWILFSERGYEQTKLSHIAQAANVHLQTLYAHFPNKAELAAATDQELLRKFKHEVKQRETSVLVFWRDWLSANAKKVMAFGEPLRQHNKAMFAEPSMSATLFNIWFEYQEVLAAELAKDLGVRRSDPLPNLIAGMLVTAMGQSYRQWLRASRAGNLARSYEKSIDYVIEKFAPLF